MSRRTTDHLKSDYRRYERPKLTRMADLALELKEIGEQNRKASYKKDNIELN